MSLAEDNYLWILEHQILPNQYGLKRVALSQAIDILKAAAPLAASSSPAWEPQLDATIRRVIQIIETHRRQVELSPGVGKEPQRYGIAVCDDILDDLLIEYPAAVARLRALPPAPKEPT